MMMMMMMMMKGKGEQEEGGGRREEGGGRREEGGGRKGHHHQCEGRLKFDQPMDSAAVPLHFTTHHSAPLSTSLSLSLSLSLPHTDIAASLCHPCKGCPDPIHLESIPLSASCLSLVHVVHQKNIPLLILGPITISFSDSLIRNPTHFLTLSPLAPPLLPHPSCCPHQTRHQTKKLTTHLAGH